MRRAKLVIMDEATANIDVQTEKLVQKLIQEEFAGSTIITIAHRVNTIITSDKVMVMSFGKVIEYDNPQLLIEDPQSEFASIVSEIKEKENEEQ